LEQFVPEHPSSRKVRKNAEKFLLFQNFDLGFFVDFLIAAWHLNPVKAQKDIDPFPNARM